MSNDTGHTLTLLRGVLILFAALLVAVFAQSYNGRRDVVQTERASCLGFDRTVLVPLANALRADEEANTAVANDPRQPKATRRARLREAAVQRATLELIDRRIDVTLIGLVNPVGQQIIRGFGDHAFRCERAYPSASPWQFFG